MDGVQKCCNLKMYIKQRRFRFINICSGQGNFYLKIYRKSCFINFYFNVFWTSSCKLFCMFVSKIKNKFVSVYQLHIILSNNELK
jgi:hypothetical protein